MLESLFNKVTHVLSYNLCGIFQSTYFLIIPQNQTTLLGKQISKSNITEMVARVFIGILQNIFRSYSFFSQSPKVVFWTNSAFPLHIPITYSSFSIKLLLNFQKSLPLLLSSFLKHENKTGKWSVKRVARTSAFLTETCMELKM